MTATTPVNAPLDAVPGDSQSPERYVIVWLDAGAWQTLVYHCRDESSEWTVGRTYLRDEHGIHTDGRWPADAIAMTRDELGHAIIGENGPQRIAVPVRVAVQIFPGMSFASSGAHPTLGVQVLP